MYLPVIGNSSCRPGITPVVSIVMLLMMTIAATGAAYSWFDQIQQDIQDKAKNKLETSIELRDLQCIKDSNGDHMLIALKNTGKRDIRGDSVDLYVYDNNGELYAAITNQNWETGANWQMASPSGEGFLTAGGFGQVLVDMPSDAQFSDISNDFFTVNIAFPNSDISKPLSGCVAE